MSSNLSAPESIAGAARFDAVVVGASLAGCTTAQLLARHDLRIALVEKKPDPNAFKRVCGHFIQSSAVPTLERLGLLTEIEAAGGVRSRVWLETPWGRVSPPTGTSPSVNIRRERLDPLARRAAAEQPGVELMLGRTAQRFLSTAGGLSGIEVVDTTGKRTRLLAPLVIAADGRESPVARLAGIRPRTALHSRFSYAAYYEGPPPAGSPDGTIWFLDPHWAAAFPTDGGLTMYACMPTADRLPEFKRDPAAALEAFVTHLPGAPPIRESRRIGPVIGKIKMPNVQRGPVGPALALVGDAALATDPLWGVGCGWAFQSGEWLADSVAPALCGTETLERGLRRYRRRWRRRLGGHVFLINDYASGRSFGTFERLLYSAAVHDPAVAERLGRFGSRNIGPERLMTPPTFARMAAVEARRRLRRHPVTTGDALGAAA